MGLFGRKIKNTSEIQKIDRRLADVRREIESNNREMRINDEDMVNTINEWRGSILNGIRNGAKESDIKYSFDKLKKTSEEYKKEMQMRDYPNKKYVINSFDEAIQEITRVIEQSKNKKQDSDDPLKIIKLRYAKGEITREEFEQMKKDLS